MTDTKKSEGKLDMSLIPRVALERLAEALMVGEAKHGRYNYTQGGTTSQWAAGAVRHLFDYLAGEDRCPKDKQHHLGAAMANCAIALHCEELGTLTDNRYVPVKNSKPDTIWKVTARGKRRTDLVIVLAHYNTRQEAEAMAEFHMQTWDPTNYTTHIEEVPA